jgi:Flp pilus assembly protein TadD
MASRTSTLRNLRGWENPLQDRAADLAARARRLRSKGKWRPASLALREACHLDESNAANWMLYGALAARMGKRADAEQAMKHALWLRERGGDARRAAVIRRVLLKLAAVSHT